MGTARLEQAQGACDQVDGRGRIEAVAVLDGGLAGDGREHMVAGLAEPFVQGFGKGGNRLFSQEGGHLLNQPSVARGFEPVAGPFQVGARRVKAVSGIGSELVQRQGHQKALPGRAPGLQIVVQDAFVRRVLVKDIEGFVHLEHEEGAERLAQVAEAMAWRCSRQGIQAPEAVQRGEGRGSGAGSTRVLKSQA